MSQIVCTECGGKIEVPRQGKKYCSDACKQTNYRKNKIQVSMQEKSEEIKNEVLELNFRMSEFDEFKKWCKDNNIQSDLTLGFDALESYCFFRKDIIQMRDFSELIKYYDEKPEEWTLELWQNPESEQGQEFKKFKDSFENDLVKFLE